MTVDTKIACIGAGYWGKNLVRNFHALGAPPLEGSPLSWICEVSPERPADLSAQYPGVRLTDFLEPILLDPQVARSEDRPHLVRGGAYKRVGAADVQMSRAEYERLLLACRQPPFDQQLVEGATYADLDEGKVRDFLRRRQEAYPGTTLPSAPVAQVIAEMLEGARERDGELVPTYMGLLFFGRDPQRFLSRAEVKLARFQGTTTLAFIDRLIVHGALPETPDEAERFIRRNTRTAMKVVEFESVQVTEYPYDAIREALVNAMAHRDYHHSSGIQVNIFDDRLEVMSPGEALIPLSELEGFHVTRNETLCHRFRDIGEMEQFGTGITKRELSHIQYILVIKSLFLSTAPQSSVLSGERLLRFARNDKIRSLRGAPATKQSRIWTPFYVELSLAKDNGQILQPPQPGQDPPGGEHSVVLRAP